MQELDDITLLREYAERDSEQAFATLVARHVNKVYSVALRHTRNPNHAEEITQAVFVILARKANELHQHAVLSGWLYQTARLTAVTLIRSEIRRARREQEAYMQSTLKEHLPVIWEELSPLIDSVIGKLDHKDRDALVLRFFDGKSMQEVGAVLGTNEDAAKMRVSRALEKIRKLLTKRGVHCTTSILAKELSNSSICVAPAMIVKSATTVALTKGATASTSTLTLIKGALKIMAWTKAQTAIISAVIIGMATYSVIQHQAQAKLRQQNESLQQQMAQLQTENKQLLVKQVQTPHLPAPQIQMTNSAVALPPQNLSSTNLYARFLDKPPKLTAEQIGVYLKSNRTNATSLLAAYRTSGDPALLKEAMEKYPNDPQIAFEAALDKDLSPDEQRQWLNTFEKSAPDNALANYLSALNYFNSGQIDQGIQELTAASGKQQFDDYTLNRMENDEEAYLSAGYSAAEAEIIADSSLMLSQLPEVKQLGRDLIALANAYSQSGDQNSAQASLQMAMNLGQNVAGESSNPALISQLVGISIERIAFSAMDPNSPYGGSGQTVQDQLNLLAQQEAALRAPAQQAEPLYPLMSDQDVLNYENRRKIFGEVAALQWIVSKYGQQ